VPGPGALVSYIQTGDRDARIAYRELPDDERLAYRDTVSRVYDTALTHHFGDHPSQGQVHDLIERVADRHPQYAGGVRRVLQSFLEGRAKGGINPRQILTAQHLVIREIAKLHPDFRERADRIVADASRTPVAVGARSAAPDRSGASSDPEVLRLRAELEAYRQKHEEMRATLFDLEFTGADANPFVSVTLGLDGMLRRLELLRGVERVGGRSIGTCIVRAWVAAEKQRWHRAKELGVHDSFPEIGSGAGRGDTFRCEAYSKSRLCRATVDRHGRLRGITFMRTKLFGDDGRVGLAAEIRESIDGAQHELKAAW
jgi:hypothetical protein